MKSSVQISWPLLTLGLVSVVFLSFLTTFAFMTFTGDDPEQAGVEDNVRLEAAVTPDENPGPADVEVPEVIPSEEEIPASLQKETDFSETETPQVEMKEIKVYAGSKVTTYMVPVAKTPVAKFEPVSFLDEDLMSRERSLRHDATPKSLVPETRSFAQALGISTPVAVIDLPVRTASLTGQMEAPGQKLLPKRYAFAVTDPAMDLAIPAVPSGFSEAVMKEAPVDILSLMPREVAALEERQDVPGRKLLPKRYAFAVTEPVMDMGLEDAASGFSEIVMNEGAEVPGQKLMPKRYARLVDAPVKLEQAPVAMPAPRIVTPESQADSLEAWRKYAAAVPAGADGKPKIVIIIDDMGNNPRMAQLMGALEGPLNFAFLPYAPGVKGQTQKIREQGHELLVHMPMEPAGDENPGPNALRVNQPARDLQAAIEWNLTRFEGFVGVNNHMGSRFTKDGQGMAMVMNELKERGLLFLDSVTTGSSQGAALARQMGLPWAGRDVFLDNDVDEAAIHAQLIKVERIAQKKGLVIAIGHPHSATYRVLKAWIPTLEEKGFVLVPVSSIVEFHGTRKLAVGPAPEIASD